MGFPESEYTLEMLLTDIDNLDALVLQELECDGYILQLLATEFRIFIMPGQLLLGQDLDQGDQTQPIRQIRFEIIYAAIDCFQMFVSPSSEGILLDFLPFVHNYLIALGILEISKLV